MAEGTWQDDENDAIVADYFAMLAKELAGQPFSKTAHRRTLQDRIGRGEGSIEYKHQNISAVLVGLGETWIVGYRPASTTSVPHWKTRSNAGSRDIRTGQRARPPWLR